MNEGLWLAFAAGASTSIGPCVAPRYVAVATLVRSGGALPRVRTIGAFCAGTFLGYSAIAAAGSLLTIVTAQSRWLYLILSVSLLAGAIVSLFRSAPMTCVHEDSNVALGGTFLLGASSSLVLSPCCTPALFAFGAMFAQGSPATALSMVAAFTAGHLAPIASIFSAVVIPARFATRFGSMAGPINTGLLLALGAYYGLLA